MTPPSVQESLSEKPGSSLEPPFQESLRFSQAFSLRDPFARNDYVLEPSNEKQRSNDRGQRNSSAAGIKLAGEHLSYEQYLHDQRNKAAEQGINFHQTGVIFKDLRVAGLGAVVEYQETIFSALNPLRIFNVIRNFRYPPVKPILSGFEGVVRPGEMLLVLGRPGSGCSTFLKILANQRAGFHTIDGTVSYDGITPEYIGKHYRGDLGYCPEDDIHFPSLTVRQTLDVPTTARTPKTHLADDARSQYTKNVVDVLATVLGLTHTYNTPVGDQNIRGVSGGEKKRVSIAEMMSMRLAVACWDNTTRGLDASTALEFVQAIRTATDITKVTTIASIYQASENIYKLFDKVAVIDEGRMSYFGPADQARDYFIKMGYQPYNRQTTADFLVGVTHSLSRTPRPGFELRVPRSPQEFAGYFSSSPPGQDNSRAVQDQLLNNPVDQKASTSTYEATARAERARHLPPGSPYTSSFAMQVRILVRRRVQIILGDLTTQAIMIFNFMAQALVMGSIFFKLPDATDAYYSRGGAMFFAVLFNALSSLAEIPTLYSQRRIVSRHHKQALYHPFIDAFAFTLVDIPITAVIAIGFDIIFYFITGLQRHASNFFIFLLFTVSATLAMKAFFRGLAASFNNQATAQALSGVAMLVLVIYTGFATPKPSIIGALRWISYINPINYAFASLIANEFHGLNGQCSNLIPSGSGYEDVGLANQACATVGSLPGQGTVDGERFIELSYAYKYSDLWKNFGITMAFWIGFVAWFLYGTERGGSRSSGPTQLVFKRGTKIPEGMVASKDEERGSPIFSVNDWSAQNPPAAEAARDALPNPRGVFSWHHLTMVLSDGKMLRLLDDVSGFVAPGKLTALMGESGAGKTTLLNALAGRLRIGVITGDRFVNGGPLPPDFAAQTGYCQQMDIHLETTTVREALRFSAILRQPSSVSKEEKYQYVEEVIRMCNMEAYADAVVGLVGQGLSVEQRKRLTIGVELAAKPQLLLLLDEPTSGLGSDSAWAIIDLLKSLAGSGQAILCTIHQPSAELFQLFDKLLLLRKGGKTCYFGDIGNNATGLIQYFERNGGRKCKEGENPAEYMLDVIGAGATAHTGIDWYSAWKQSQERRQMEAELDRILQLGKDTPTATEGRHPEFAASFSIQVKELTKRAFQNYIRNSSYLLSKLLINVFGGLLLGFTYFKSDNSSQGLQNKLFASFMAVMLGSPHSNMLQAIFMHYREIFEAREQASKMYHWIPLITTSLVVEIPFNIIGASLFFLCWYWSVGFPGAAQRIGFQYLIYCVVYPLYYTTLSQAIAAMSTNGEIAALIFAFLFTLAFAFSGVLQPFSQLIPFWHWFYRLSPLTYFVEALVTNGLGNQAFECSAIDVVTIVPPSGQKCQAYMQSYIDRTGGYLLNLTDDSNCQFCSDSSTDQFLASFNLSFSHRWRDVAFLAAYIVFNTTLIYIFTYLFRIRTGHPLRSFLTHRFKKSN